MLRQCSYYKLVLRLVKVELPATIKVSELESKINKFFTLYYIWFAFIYQQYLLLSNTFGFASLLTSSFGADLAKIVSISPKSIFTGSLSCHHVFAVSEIGSQNNFFVLLTGPPAPFAPPVLDNAFGGPLPGAPRKK